jgi:hypothetical protein
MPRIRPTIKAVRHYIIKKMNGFAEFKCRLCKYSVTTMEFNGENSRCRIQAARAMNEHALTTHHCPPALSLRYAPMWHAR